MERERPEDERIRMLLDSGFDCRREDYASWTELYHLSHLRANLTEWLPIRAGDTVLEFGADTGQLTGGFLPKAKQVVCLEQSVSRSRILAKRHSDAENLSVYAGDPWETLEGLGETFDWIVAASVLSDAARYFPGDDPQAEAVRRLQRYLKAGGHLVLAADNRFGLKYWAGAMEPHTGRYFDSLEGNGDTFSRAELAEILQKGGVSDYAFYYPYPERWFPVSIYSDERLPKAGELNRNLRNFEGERLVLFDEGKVYDQLIREGRFPEFSNAYLIITGKQEGERLLYAKYSNDRAERFMIRTDIVEDAGLRRVRKVPESPEARDHVRQMKRWEEELETRYGKSGVHANRCELSGDNAYFEFLTGTTFEERLDALRAVQDYAGLASALQEYKKMLERALQPELAPFRKSATFVEMFGDPAFARAYEGAPLNNLDWIFGNLMETAEGIQVIDYEWTFPVQVPLPYLLWRGLSLYLNGREDAAGLGLMAQMGISPEEEALFAGMEHHFQLWLLDDTKTIEARYLETAGRAVTLAEMMKAVKKNRFQIYVDTGNGFSEAESFWIDTEPDKRGVVHLELLLPAGAKGLRIDPCEQTCLVKVKRLLGELGGSYALEYIHNGRELEDQGILYTTTDAQITVTNLVEGTGRVYAELTVEELLPDTAYACMNLLNRVRAAERISGSAPFRLLKKIKRGFGHEE